MKYIDKIKELMKQSKSIEDLADTLIKSDFSVCYMKEANDNLKKEHGIETNEKWHRFLVETGSTPVNKWENITQFTVILISDDLQEMKIINNS
jgi:hypothetical protein